MQLSSHTVFPAKPITTEPITTAPITTAPITTAPTGNVRKITSRGVLLFCAIVWTFAWADRSIAQNDFAMPWANDQGRVVPYGLKDRADAATKDRAAIKEAPVKTAPPAPVNNAPYDWGFLSRPLLIWMFGVAILCIIGLMVWLFVSAKLGDGGGQYETQRQGRTLQESIKQLPFELDENVGDFREQARAAYRSGDFRKSLMLLFSHVLVTLDQKDLVHLKKGKTNRQYLRELKPHPRLAGYYGDVMVPFEQTFFGDYSVEKSVCEQCWNDLDQFQANIEAVKRGGHD
jgi:hypothetical protein